MSAGVWYGKRTWLGLGFALVLALALDALGVTPVLDLKTRMKFWTVRKPTS